MSDKDDTENTQNDFRLFVVGTWQADLHPACRHFSVFFSSREVDNWFNSNASTVTERHDSWRIVPCPGGLFREEQTIHPFVPENARGVKRLADLAESR